MLKIACALAIGMAASSALAADVGVSINVGQPGYYGRIDIGAVPQPPQVIYAQPVYVQPAPSGYAPIYLRVPPGHEKHWSKHCRAYNACNRPVYFVRDDWYRNQYAPRYRGDDHRGGRGERRAERGRGDDHRGAKDRGRGDDRRGHRNDDR